MSEPPRRRTFMRRSLAMSFGFMGLRTAFAAGGGGAGGDPPIVPGGLPTGYGSLAQDPNGILDLPAGFSYVVISQTGQVMSDGFFVPGSHDGMAAFPGRDGAVVILRNHELASGSRGPFGASNELLGRLSRDDLYDYGRGGEPCIGGVTGIVYDPRTRLVKEQYLALAGTLRNCGGGPTPWGSWLSCEETTQKADASRAKDHGYVFEVPANGKHGLVKPQPLAAMGRFNHEACAVHPRFGFVYMTEDRSDSLIYRFVPLDPENLARGGELQALVVLGQPTMNTSNHNPSAQIPTGYALEVTWVGLSAVESPNDDLRVQGASKGAATFSRGEGMWYGKDAVYFTCTDGGANQRGQIWKLTPSGDPGGSDTLELFLEPNDSNVLDRGDNLTVSPWGDVMVCEDGPGDQHLVGVTPNGATYKLARNALLYNNGYSEMAGSTFSPDGRTLFLNIRKPGLTLAITGPWLG